MAIQMDDQEGVIKGAHYYLIKCYPLEKLEKEVYELLVKKKSMPLFVIWKRFDCHLWEICAVLTRLKERGLIEESNPTTEDYCDIEMRKVPDT